MVEVVLIFYIYLVKGFKPYLYLVKSGNMPLFI